MAWTDGMTLGSVEPPRHAETYVAKLTLVRVCRERNERMGLHGREGYRIYYPDGYSVWLPDETVALAFEPSSTMEPG